MQLIAVRRVLLGLLQGCIFYFLYQTTQQHTWLVIHPFIFLPLLILNTFIPLVLIQGMGNLRGKTLLQYTFLLALLLAAVSYYAVFRRHSPLPSAHGNLSFALCFFTSFVVFIIHSLVLSGDKDRKWIAHYPTYFDLSWKLAAQIGLSSAFTLLFWSLLSLSSALFHSIQLDFFEKLISQGWFIVIATCLMAAIAIHLTDVNAGMLRGVRSLNLVLFAWLLPLITLIVLVFLVSLIFTGTHPFWQTNRANLLLINTAIVLIVLINAAYQDGLFKKPLVRIQAYCMRIAGCLLLPIMGLAIYAMYLRITQFGLSVDRVYAIAVILILCCYACGYTFAAVTKLSFIEKCNFATAILIVFTYFALCSPLADPARLMTVNQLARLKNGEVMPQKFDFDALSQEGVRYGQKALKELQTWQGAQADYIRQRATEALQGTKKQASLSEKQQAIILHSNTVPLPQSLLKQTWQSVDGRVQVPACLRDGSKPCHAWIMPDENKNPMILILEEGSLLRIQETTPGVFKIMGEWIFPYQCQAKIHEAAALGKFKMVAPSADDLQILKARLSFVKNENICDGI